MNVGLQGYDQARGLQFYDEVLRRTRLLPGVLAASFAYPRHSTPDRGVRLYVDGLANSRDGTVVAQATFVADEFIPALGVRLQAGRDFTPHDDAAAPLVMIVSDSSRLACGRGRARSVSARAMAACPDITVVGVIADAKFSRRRSHPHGLSAAEAALSRLGNTRRPHPRHSRSDALPSS